MAVTFDRKLGEGTGANNVLISSVTVALNEFVVIWAACDNTAGTDQPTVSAVNIGGASQTYSVVAEHGSSSTTASNATRGFIIVVPSVSNAVTGGQIQVVLSTNAPKTVGVAAVFDGVTSTVANGPHSNTTTSGTPQFLAGASNRPTGPGLALAMVSCENNAAWGSDSSDVWDEPGGDGDVFTTGGGAAGNVSMRAAYIISTTATTYNMIVSGGANDGGICGVVLEAAPTGPAPVDTTDGTGSTDTTAEVVHASRSDNAGNTDTRALDTGLARTDSAGLVDGVTALLTRELDITDAALAQAAGEVGFGDSTSSTVNSGATGPHTIAKPSGLADGDTVILPIVSNQSNATASVTSAPSGFTLVRQLQETSSTLNVYRKHITDAAGEPAWEITYSGAVKIVAEPVRYTGVDSTDPFVDEDGAIQTGTSDTITSPAVTVNEDGCWIVTVAANRDGTAATWSMPDTERQDVSVTGSSQVSMAVSDSDGPVAQGTPTKSATSTASTTNQMIWVGVLRPAPGSSGSDAVASNLDADRTDGAGSTDADVQDIGVDRTDAANLTDSPKVVNASGDGTDPLGLTDEFSYSVETGPILVDTSDTEGLTDSAQLTVALDRADTEGLTDARSVAVDKAATDDTGLTDAATPVLARDASATDTLGLTDRISVDLAADRTDATGGTDAISEAVDYSATDNAGLADAASTTGAGTYSASDSTGLTDQVAITVNLARSDSEGLTDARTLDVGESASDSAGTTDARAVDVTKAVTDSAGLTDAITVSGAGTSSQADTLGLTDSVQISVTLSRADSAGTSDAATAERLRSASFTDNAGLTDAAASAKFRAVDTADSANLTDATARVVSASRTDDMGLTDAVSISLVRTVSDDMPVTDAHLVVVDRDRAQADLENLTDTVEIELARAYAASDNVTLSDAVDFALSLGLDVSDLLGLDDDITTLHVAGAISGNVLHPKLRVDNGSRTVAVQPGSTLTVEVRSAAVAVDASVRSVDVADGSTVDLEQ